MFLAAVILWGTAIAPTKWALETSFYYIRAISSVGRASDF